MLKVAIVGCGKIADSHAQQIQRIPGCSIVAACDREELMAKQFCQRFHINRHFDDLAAMLKERRPDVVHVTTPAESHHEAAKACLLHGAHVYVEKPFTLNSAQAEELILLADRTGLKLTVGHDDQFRHAARRMRQMVRGGYLGGPPVHLESYYCYELGESSAYARALLADKGHWVRRLPGQLLHNIISHGIARIVEFLVTEDPQVLAHGFVSQALKRMGENDIVDELRVIISEKDGLTAYFTFSSQMRPSLHQFRLFGPKNGLILDQDNETLIKLRGKRFKSYVEAFVPPVIFAREYLGNLATNLRLFASNDFHPKSGMKYLIESFYQSITQDTPLPITNREILLTTRIMEDIFGQLYPKPIEAARQCDEAGGISLAMEDNLVRLRS